MNLLLDTHVWIWNPADRFIAATALIYGLHLMTLDKPFMFSKMVAYC
jgi:PIN domain nuclease of toxin-antitoxin system